MQIFDTQGNPVTALTTNTEGWPTPNPLTVQMTFTNTTSANLPEPLLALEINSPFAPGLGNEREGRFFVLDENGFGGGDEFPHIAQYRKVVEPGAMTPGQVKTISATVWVQPSVTTTLDIKAEFYADSWASDLLGEDTAVVDVPLAAIHPVVLMPGLLASFPPGPDGLPDPLMQTYDNMLAALKQAGYESGQGWFSSEYDPQYAGSGATLLAFGYDWRNPLGQTGQTAVKDYIDRIINTPMVDQKPYVNYNQVTIVAHSTGGLIARAYIENGEANKHTVNKLITLGTPHEGTLAAYRAWYGGDPTGIIPDIEMFRALLGLFAWCEGNNTQYTDSSIPEIYALMTEDYYNYFRARVPSATDFMPRANYVPTPYLQALPVLPAPLLCGGQNNYDYCYGKPPSDFLDDLNTPGGLFDVTRLNAPDLPIISAYSSAFDTDGVYNVSPPSSPPPPSFPLLPKPEFWKYGELANIPQDIVMVDGDRLVPEFSGDLTRIAGYANITGLQESNQLSSTKFDHMSLNYDPVMVRRIVSYVTNIPETDIRPSFWNAPYDGTRNFWDNVAIASCSPVRLIATDPLGRRAGLDLESGQIINEIPGAFVSEDGVDPQVILLPDIKGPYQVQGIGVEEGDYKIGALLSITQTESVVVVSSQTGTTTIGQDYGFTFDTRIPPVAAFRATPLTGTVPLTVTFSDETAGAANSWLWNYGDGQNDLLASSSNPVHVYTGPGLYTVSLTVNGEYGAHTFTRTGYISVTNVSPPTPTPTPTDVGDYAVFGLNSVWLRQGSDLHSGHVGVQNASPGPVLASGAEVTIGRGVTFHDPTSAIAGDTIKLKLGASVFDIFHNELDPAANATYGQVITPLNLPLTINLPVLPQITPGSTDYTLVQNEHLTLPAGAYGDITLKKNSVLTLTGGVYHLSNLNLGDNSQVIVTAPTEVRIAERLQPGEKAVIGPAAGSGLDATDLVFFIGGINGNSGDLGATPKAAVIGLNNVVTATIYAPNGTLWLKQRTEARGAFIGQDVKIGYNVQVWLENAFAGGYQSP